MLTTLSVSNFKAVPYLETSALMQTHKGTVRFSTKKPNVVVGPNGAGKSALLRTLALRFLATQVGESQLDGQYVVGRDADELWTKLTTWGRESEFLAGLEAKTDNGPARYYRPNLIPGEKSSGVTAMMCGYFEEAKAYMRETENKSDGQANLTRLAHALALLDEETSQAMPAYPQHNWRFGRDPLSPAALRKVREDFRADPMDLRAETLKSIAQQGQTGTPLLLLDEPEQSLDALAEVSLWKQLEAANPEKVQVVVASHSLYPLLHPKKFKLIEAVPGYIAQVQSALGMRSS